MEEEEEEEEEKKDFKPPTQRSQKALFEINERIPYQEDLSPIGEVAFVNRTSETVEIAETLLHNARLGLHREIDKPFLVTIAQMYGSGKTMMGKNAIPRARALYNESAEWRQGLSGRGFDPKLIKTYLHARYVLVDMTELDSGATNLGASLAGLLYRSLGKEMGLPYCNLPSGWGMEAVVEHFLAFENTKREQENAGKALAGEAEDTPAAFFLHWDEVGAIEGSTSFGWPPLVEEEKSDFQSRLRRYYDVWEKWIPLLRHPNVFLLATGKQPGFSLIGQKLLQGRVSPTRHRSIVLGRLKVEHIVEMIEKSTLRNGITVLESLKTKGITEDNLKSLCEVIEYQTAGLPRLVYRTLQALLNEAITQENLQDKVAIEAAMDGFVFEKLSTRSPTETFVSPTALEPGWSSAYIALLLWSILDLPPVPLKAKIWIGNHQLPLAHVIDRLDVFLDRVHSQGQVPHQEQYVRFCFAKFVIRHFLEIVVKDTTDPRGPMIQPLLRNQTLLSEGEPLELLIRVVLVWRITQFELVSTRKATWSSCFPFFARSSLKDEPLPQGPIAISHLPIMTTDVRVKKPVAEVLNEIKATPWKAQQKKVRVENWSLVVEQLFPVNTVGHPGPKASCPDILFHLPNTIIGFQAKQFDRSALHWNEIQEEIKKTRPLCEVKRVCLVMVALVLSESIQQILGTSEALALQSGYWWLDEDQLKCTQDNSPPRSLSDRLFQLGMRQPKKATLEIPREMELVILGKEGVNQLLGKVNVEALSNLTQDCANITSFSYLFLPMVPESGGRQLSKRKHAPEEMLDTSEEGQTREAKQSRSVGCTTTVFVRDAEIDSDLFYPVQLPLDFTMEALHQVVIKKLSPQQERQINRIVIKPDVVLEDEYGLVYMRQLLAQSDRVNLVVKLA
jgi:hypothetical protein